MSREVYLPGLGFAYLGINLCGGEVGVSQQFLDNPEVGTTVKHVSGKGMAQYVGVYPPADTRGLSVFLQYLLHHSNIEFFSKNTYE